MRVSRLVFLSILLLASPLFAADPQAQALAEPIGVLHLEGQKIEVFSWSWGVTQTVDSASAVGGGAGKVQMQDFHFTKTVDKSSPSLFKACATGKHFPQATFTARKKGEGQQDYLVVKFDEVLVSSYQTGGSAGDTIPMESISLNFANVEILVP